MASNNVLSASF